MKNQPHAEDLVFNSKPIAESGQAFTLDPQLSGMHRRRERERERRVPSIVRCTSVQVYKCTSVLHSTNVQFTTGVQHIQS